MGDFAGLCHTELSAFAFDTTFHPAPPPQKYTPLKEMRGGDQFKDRWKFNSTKTGKF